MSFEKWRVKQTDKELEKSEKTKVDLFTKIKEKEEKEHKVFYGDEKSVLWASRPEPKWKEDLNKSTDKPFPASDTGKK